MLMMEVLNDLQNSRERSLMDVTEQSLKVLVARYINEPSIVSNRG